MHTIAYVLVAMVPAWMFATKNVERALTIVILYLGLLDGFLKLKTGSSNATLARDLFLYAVVFGDRDQTGGRAASAWHWPPLTVWVVGWTAFVLVQLLNPVERSGAAPRRLAAPGSRVRPAVLPRLRVRALARAAAKRCSILLVFIAAVNGAVSLYQSSLSPESALRLGHGLLQPDPRRPRRSAHRRRRQRPADRPAPRHSAAIWASAEASG